MNIEDTLAPKSEQLDAIELVSGPRIFTVESVSRGNVEQPVNVHFVDFPRPWRPSKGMRRVLAACWGAEAAEWTGRSVELFYDPEVTFGREKPGGTRIKRISHIDGTKRVPLLISQGRSGTYVVEPLPDEPTVPNEQQVAASDDRALLREWWNTHPNLRGAIEARVNQLNPESVPAESGLFEDQA